VSASLAAEMVEMNEFVHIPVMRDAVLEMARHAAPRQLVDCTVGGAGHAQALLEAFPTASLLALDRDPTAVAVARSRLAPYGARAQVVQARFSALSEVLADQGIAAVDVLLADFGVSSHQLDTGARGFSFRDRATLDMRMDPEQGPTAWEIIAGMDETRLANAIYTLGEERHSRRVARAMVHDKPRTTEELAAMLRRIVPKSADGLDPATRTFQALRMLVNEELEEISAWLAAVPQVLNAGGVAIAISFHSLEDRAVKNAFRQEAKGCICPPTLPVCACGRLPTLRLLTPKVRLPDAAEISANPRARSARLRAALRRARQP
jgi:16S rRNA (cytosine1402-N4)-methyltransferase